jgi:hypothetical protein
MARFLLRLVERMVQSSAFASPTRLPFSRNAAAARANSGFAVRPVEVTEFKGVPKRGRSGAFLSGIERVERKHGCEGEKSRPKEYEATHTNRISEEKRCNPTRPSRTVTMP